VCVDQLDDYVIPRLTRRLTRAYEAHVRNATVYLEHGEPTLTDVI